MPLKSGSSRYIVGQNIKELMGSGRKQSQSIAIALDKAGKSKNKKGKGKGKSSDRYRDGARLTSLKMPKVVMDSN